MKAQELTPKALVDQYLDVVNRALAQNRDDFPYDKILSASEKLLDDKRVAVGVYQDSPSNPHHWFTASFNNQRFRIEEQGKGDADFKWLAREAHMEEVVENPDTYIESPIKLDMDWLKKAIGLDS